MPQTGAVVRLENYHVALCVHVVEMVRDAAMTKPRLTRKGKRVMTTQLIQMKKKNANEPSFIFTSTLFLKFNFVIFYFCSCIPRFIVLKIYP